ncbi:pyruvate dehydrogenase (acetyl-transferring) E1 component subunit alpha [Isoptericola sp. b490]|uniref:pyruvate dehydrogenase (acetyl-transferring) E1 component subunit alpha n=1 Tax=Actinotalea lenta TaxID=3064654 RepID=UPI00271254BE|nr:pyruvate dehydrogenase (acetyl-transferring) E1 component subunit alpha [Isoptericola sp. b490]MDO8122036.1 pyruvate dehydrogenase (acetyl-transferring) E1 component subunit alpha [Isoptericola sp. b490]
METVQLLTPEGTRVADARYDRRVAHLDADALRGFYADMVLTRRFDTEATALQRQGELGLFTPSMGQEAAQVGSAHALAPQDWAFPAYREHGVLHVRGVDLVDVLKQFRGVDHGGWDPAEHHVHLFTLVVGAHPLHAVGYAMGMQRDGVVGTGDPQRDAGVIAYLGDGATSQGDVSEALVFAGASDAPVVFFVQNNQWAISVPVGTQSKVPLAQRGQGFGIPTVRVDGNDVLASYAVTAEAMERAHRGHGPTFIEAVTYRMGAHTTSDDPLRYREDDEVAAWRAKDPIDRLRRYLESAGELPQDFLADLEARSEALARHVRDGVHAMTAPEPTSMFDHVYASPHSLVQSERAWFEQYEAGLAEGGAR